MDDKSVNYSQDRYNEIKAEVEKMLTKIGYKTKKIPFIPMSGFKGENLSKPSENMPWWKGFEVKIKKDKVSGVTLIDALEKVVKQPKRPTGILSSLLLFIIYCVCDLIEIYIYIICF